MKKIQVSHLSFGYDKEKKVIHDASFAIEAGSYTTIIGHNGSGKSTIAKLMIGLLESDSGVITVDDLELSEANIHEIRDRIGIVFQNPDNQFIGASVADDIAFGLENHQVPSEEMQDIIEEFADRVHMRKFLNSEPTKLSGGQKQRVAIAGVLAMKPQIIIFDEATSMLDPQGKAEINALIQDIHAKSNLTIISITHDIEEVAHSDHVIVLDQGNIVLDGTPEEVLFHEQGLLGGLMHLLHLPGADWMNTPWAFWILVFSYIWKNLGYDMVLWLAGLSGIPISLYEAAQADGAGRWQCFRYVTLPNLLPSLFTISVLSVLNSFKVFREAYLAAGDYPHESMYLLQHLFNNWYRDLSMDKMAAGAVVQAGVIFMMVLLLKRAWD